MQSNSIYLSLFSRKCFIKILAINLSEEKPSDKYPVFIAADISNVTAIWLFMAVYAMTISHSLAWHPEGYIRQPFVEPHPSAKE